MIYHVTWLTPKGGEEQQTTVVADRYQRVGNVTYFFHGEDVVKIRNVFKVVGIEQDH